MRSIEDCPHRKVVEGEGRDEVAHCRLVEDVARARLLRAAGVRSRERSPATGGKLRLGFLSASAFLGGAERWHATLIPRLDREQFTVEGIAVLYPFLTHSGQMDELAGTCPVACGPEAIRDLAGRVDVLVVWGIAELGPHLPPWIERPMVVMVMHSDGREASVRASAAVAAVDVDHWVCVGPPALEAVPRPFRSRATVISNGVDPERVRPTRPREEIRAEWGIGPERRVLGFLGRISPEKNPEALADAIAALHRRGRTEWIGVQVGDGFLPDYVARVRQMAKLKAGTDVVMTAGRTDVGNCLAAFDALLVPSHGEACGLAVIEGWMAGVPVIATRVGIALENPDLVAGLDTPCSGEDVARAIVGSVDLQDEATAARVARARAFALEHLSAEPFARRWGAYLQSLDATPPPDLVPPGALDGLCNVHRSACAACCNEDEPTLWAMNPVISSHVFMLAHKLTERGKREGREVGAAMVVKHWAVNYLPQIVLDEAAPLPPPPNDGPCFHLGKQTGTRECKSCRGSVRLKVFQCHHPLHEQTTRLECRFCDDFDAQLGRGHVRKWAVGVTTAPRESPTLERCLKSLARAGWSAPRLFAEPGVEVPEGFPRVTVTRRERRIGEWSNWYLGLAELVQRHPSADAYMMVQDDTIFCDNVRAFLEADLWPSTRLGLVSVYCPGPYARQSTGWHRVGTEYGLVGALTFIFPNAAARLLLGHPMILNHRRKRKEWGRVDTDGLVGRWAWQSRLPTYYVSPSLAQHIGETSAIWPDAPNSGARHSYNFIGEEFDARGLISNGPRETAQPEPDGASRSPSNKLL